MSSTPERDAALLRGFDSLIELRDDARERRLAELSIENPELASALRAMLDADAAADGPLESDVDSVVERLVAQTSTPLTSGQRIGPFELERPLGSGGMGEVWLAAREESGFRQTVALKRLKRGMDSDEILRRFVQERRILASLSHPNIARFIDGGVDADGTPWYAMEYVEGESITLHAARLELDVRTRVALLAEVCEAVAYAQHRLVVHRDLKPSNILVDASGVPHLLDFGIAKLLSAGPGTETATGLRALSPAYAAPEQVLDEPISAATDVYALGVVLYELLTDELPHARAGLSLEALVDRVRNETTERPSARLRASGRLGTDASPTQRPRRTVSGELDAIVLTALRREPERRYASAAAMAEDLRRWLNGRPVRAQPDTATYRLRKFVARNRLAVGSASAVLLALLAGLALALWQADLARQQALRAQHQTERAEAALAASTEAADRTRRVKDFMMRSFIAADPMQRPGGAAQTIAEAFDEALQRIDSEVADDPKLQVDLLDDFGEVRANQGRFDEAKVLFERALALAESLYPADDPVIAETLLNQVAINNAVGNPLQALPQAERAAAILREHQQSLPMQYANALGGLAIMRGVQGRSEDSLQLAREALEITRQHYDPRSDALVAALNNVSSGLINLGRYAEAEPFARAGVAEAERVWGPDAPRLADLLGGLQLIVYQLGRYDEAAQHARRGVEVTRAAFGDDHPMTASALADLATIEQELGQVDAARTHFDTAVEVLQTTDSDQLILVLRMRALFRRGQDDPTGALDDFEAAIALCLRQRPDHLLCQLLRANRAGHLARMGRGEEALRESEAALAAMERMQRTDDNEYAQALESRAFALQAVGRTAEARATQERAIARYEALFGAEHRETERARGNLTKL